jgi:esterase/lipase superfamily enzyme
MSLNQTIDLNKINTSNFHYRGSSIIDDNILITNMDNATKIFSNIFTDIVEYHKGIGYIENAETNFTNFLKRNNLIEICEKTDKIDFRLLRENKVWF